jgi:hypothetical protein
MGNNPSSDGWSQWGECDKNGNTTRTKRIQTVDSNGKIISETTQPETRPCATYCTPGQWTTTSAGCNFSTKKATQETKFTSSDGIPCVKALQTRDVFCEKRIKVISPWEPCTTETTFRDVIYNVVVNGNIEGEIKERESTGCVKYSQNGQWGDWSVCNKGTSTRPRDITSYSSDGTKLSSKLETETTKCECAPTSWVTRDHDPKTNEAIQTRNFISNNGVPCDPSYEKRAVPVTDYSRVWSPWEPCQDGFAVRNQEITFSIEGEKPFIKKYPEKLPCAKANTCIPASNWRELSACDPVTSQQTQTQLLKEDANGIPCEIPEQIRVVTCTPDEFGWGPCTKKRTRTVTKMVNGKQVSRTETEEIPC